MKKYERHLKDLISKSDGGCKFVFGPDSGLSEAEMRFLSAKGFVSLFPAGDGDLFIRLDECGLTYFSDKQEALTAFLREHLFSFISGVLSGFVSGVLLTLAVQFLAT